VKRFWASLTLCLLVAGCGGATANTKGSGGATSPGSKEAAATYFKDCHNTIQIIVGQTAGGATDMWARLLADAMSKSAGVKFQVVNVPGAGGSIGINKVTSAKKDGCTLGTVNLPSSLQYLFPNSKVQYTKADFALIGDTGYSPNTIVVAKDSPYKTLKDLIADAKARPGKVNAASDGPGSDDAVAYIRLQDATGMKINQVVLNGSADKVTSLLGGQIDFFGGSVTGVMAQIRNAQFRALCVYADKASVFIPDVPTCKSQGADVLSDIRWGLFTAVGVPAERVQILEDLTMKVAAQADYKAANEKLSIEVSPLTSKELSAEWDRQAEVYKKVTSKM